MNNPQILELASNLAHKRTIYELPMRLSWLEEDIYKIENGVSVYKDDFQDNFNHWYEYYTDEILKIITN